MPTYRSPDDHSAVADSIAEWKTRYGKAMADGKADASDDDCLTALMRWPDGVEERVFVARRASDGKFAPLITYR